MGMKICFLSSMHLAEDKRVFHKEALSLVAAGHTVSHICPGDVSDTYILKGVKVVTYMSQADVKGRLSQIFMLYSIACAENADSYHCNEVDSWLVGVLLKLFKKKLCVFDVHEHYPSTFAEGRFSATIQPIVAWCVRLSYRILTPFTDRLVLAKQTVSEDFHCSDSKKVLVRNFTQRSNFHFFEKKPPAIAGETITLIHFGLFSKIRGWPQLLDALRLIVHENYKLEIIGEFNDGTRDEFENVVKEYGLSDRIVIRDWMPFEEASRYLFEAHIGLVVFQPERQNHVYAMPHKMFDYMAAGMAVICPCFAVEIAPIIKESSCGFLVDSSDPEDLATKLDELISDINLMYEMGVRGQLAVRDHYNWENEADMLIQMYGELEVLL